jgi:hypothetical protein
MLEQIETQLKELATKLERSAANHNFLLGCKTALENLYSNLTAAAPAAEAVVAVVDPAAAPAVDAAVSTVEAVVNAVDPSAPVAQ